VQVAQFPTRGLSKSANLCCHACLPVSIYSQLSVAPSLPMVDAATQPGMQANEAATPQPASGGFKGKYTRVKKYGKHEGRGETRYYFKIKLMLSYSH